MTKEEKIQNIRLLCLSIALGLICFTVSHIGKGTPFEIYSMFGYMAVYCASVSAISLIIGVSQNQKE